MPLTTPSPWPVPLRLLAKFLIFSMLQCGLCCCSVSKKCDTKTSRQLRVYRDEALVTVIQRVGSEQATTRQTTVLSQREEKKTAGNVREIDFKIGG